MTTTEQVTDRRAIALDGHDPWVHRFGRTERFAHWWTVSTVALALLSGIAMGDDGGGPLLVVHVSAVVLIGAGLVAAIAFGDRPALVDAARHLFVIERREARWLRATLRHPLRRDPEPPWGMFNPGQKLLAWALSASVLAVIVTGILSWSAGGEGGLHAPAVLVTAALLSAHLFMAVLNPATRPALNGMVFGHVRHTWAAKHHAQWLQDMRR
ncbi:MAG TPA: cytochrome b/b6 domain-containing protein [Mycobacterium sp.]